MVPSISFYFSNIYFLRSVDNEVSVVLIVVYLCCVIVKMAFWLFMSLILIQLILKSFKLILYLAMLCKMIKICKGCLMPY